MVALARSSKRTAVLNPPAFLRINSMMMGEAAIVLSGLLMMMMTMTMDSVAAAFAPTRLRCGWQRGNERSVIIETTPPGTQQQGKGVESCHGSWSFSAPSLSSTTGAALFAKRKRRRRADDNDNDNDEPDDDPSRQEAGNSPPLPSSSSSEDLLPDFVLPDEEAAMSSSRRASTTTETIPADFTPFAAGSTSANKPPNAAAARSVRELIGDRSLERKMVFDDATSGTALDGGGETLPDLTQLAVARSSTSRSTKRQEQAARKAALQQQRGTVLTTSDSENDMSSLLSKIPLVTNDKGEITPTKILEAGTWLGIFLLIGWELYINSPFFDRAAPMAPVVY
jgi:hypothetical protein